MANQRTSANPRLQLLRRDLDQTVIKRFRAHGWRVNIVREIDQADCIEISADKGGVGTRIAVLYSSATSNDEYREIANRVDHIFFNGEPYRLESFTMGVSVPVEPLGDFFPFFVDLSKRVEPDRSPPVTPRKKARVLRLTAENPLEAVITRLQQFASVKLAAKLVERRAEAEGTSAAPTTTNGKATGIAYSMSSALDYIVSSSSDKLNKRILGLYYGTMALAQAEMLASPSGPSDLDEVEGMTKQGHGLYTFPGPSGGFADLRVGVLRTGFLPQWMSFLGHNASRYPRRKPRSPEDLEKLPADMVCSLRDLFASMPEIDDLFAEVLGGPPKWITVAYDSAANAAPSALNATAKKADSTYGLFIDGSGLISGNSLTSAGWPLAEVQEVDHEDTGVAFRARVDHDGHDLWWNVLPTQLSPFASGHKLLFPTVGGLREYRAIAAVTLYALSIMVRYMPSAWWRVEGGDEDHYLALVKAALAVWERILPEHFLESIAGERVHTAQPGSFFA